MLIVVSRALGYDPNPVEEVVRGLTEDALHVAHEPVHIPLAPGLLDNVFVIVISQTTRQLFIIHFWLVFAETPSSRNLHRHFNVNVEEIYILSNHLIRIF